MKIKILLALLLFHAMGMQANSTKQIPITIENNKTGAPITIGIPFPKGTLFSVDHLRLLDHRGKEIICQTTEVSTWEPADKSIKWVWVFFFSEKSSNYILEYGEHVSPMQPKEKIISSNNMRPRGGIDVNTGPLSFRINKMGNGFLDVVYLDLNSDGQFSENELISSAQKNKRGTFLDIMDAAGIDASNATINQVFREKGSGPLHVIFKVEGTYSYNQKDNNSAPFELKIHAYAGKSYIKILHTLTYTGVPDKHKKQLGEHSNIATQNKKIISEATSDDIGWTEPNDQISGCGLNLVYHLDSNQQVLIPFYDGDWSQTNPKERIVVFKASPIDKTTLLQTGPLQNNPDAVSSPTKKTSGFDARAYQNNKLIENTEKAKGWIDLSDESKGIAIGIKNFYQEYPKALEIDPKTKTLNSYIWPAAVDPMSFERKNTKKDGGMLGNFAQGIAKTTEFIYYFHEKTTGGDIDNVMDYSLKPAVAHASSEWYTASKVYGNMAPYSLEYPEYENALQYKYDWWIYNQNWDVWYGMFNHGDGKSYYNKGEWQMWNNNEPTIDFMLWTNFMRTGEADYYYAAQNMSKHTMDVDNIHWPKKRKFVGDINDAIDWWNFKEERASTPYLGIGRRHGDEHWSALLSAHVWIQGWIASYYITGDTRALEVAKMTGDTYINKIWGDHGLRGRRLYLSILNLVELYDATKLEKYKIELDERVELLLSLQTEQGGNLILDRFGYSQNYVAQGLYKYWQLSGDDKIKKALIKHARWVREVPPLNHEMESYLATIYPLILGYEFTGNKQYLKEAINRAKVLRVAPLNYDFTNQKEYSNALKKVSNLPVGQDGTRTIWKIDNGLRAFGWTHAYNIPYLLYYLNQEKNKHGNL
jgi:hypothetical protein